MSDAAYVRTIDEIVAEYQAQDLRLTGRQLYYQFVARGLVENTEKSYKKLLSVLTLARYAGLVDWDAVEDRGRVATVWRRFSGPRAAVETVIRGYRLDRWEGQRAYAELWVEKQALAGVLEGVAWEFQVTLAVNKGYSSASAMYEAARRFAAVDGSRTRLLLYLGDHDPSGEDMVRDVEERLAEFGQRVDVRKVALTMEQVEEHRPPPNPAKMSDSRAAAYVQRHGSESWEVDALPPQTLVALVRAELEAVVDRRLVRDVEAREAAHVRALRDAAARLEAGGETGENEGDL